MYKIFHDLALLQVQNGALSNLFHIDRNTGVLTEISFAQNQKHLVVHEKLQLIETDNGLFCINGKHLSVLTGNMEIIPYQKKFLLVIRNAKHVHVLLWDGKNIFLSLRCQGFVHNNMHFAVLQKRRWLIFNGSEVIFGVEAKTMELHRGLVLYVSKDHSTSLYDLQEHQYLLKNMKNIVVSDTAKFVVGIDSEKNAHVLWENTKKRYSNAEDCGILSESEKIFYLQKNKKYFLYYFNGHRMFKSEYRKGADFICYNERSKSLLIINNNVAEFLQRE